MDDFRALPRHLRIAVLIPVMLLAATGGWLLGQSRTLFGCISIAAACFALKILSHFLLEFLSNRAYQAQSRKPPS